VADLEAKYRRHLASQLEVGEELSAHCIASQQKGLFRGGAVAIGVTDRRLLVQPLDRRGEPESPPQSIAREQVSSAKAGPAGGEWFNVDAAILDHAAVRLEIRTIDGEKVKLMLMRGEGRVLGGLGGGEPQRRGIEALAEWFSRLPPH
jgi:hypothetical protein